MSTLIQHSTGSLSQHKRQQKEIKTYRLEIIKQFLLANDMTV